MIAGRLFDIRGRYMGIALTLTSAILVSVLQWWGVFDGLELKVMDYYFYGVRGPLTGLLPRDSTYVNKGTDIVLVEIDDEAYRLMPESYPYSRGYIWSRVVRNLAQAGAKVIVFDVEFDQPELRYIQSGGLNSTQVQGDKSFGDAIAEVQKQGVKVVLAANLVREPNLYPPQYIAKPVGDILSSGATLGLVNDILDQDNFTRRYPIFWNLEHDPDSLYLTLGLMAIQAYADLEDTVRLRFDPKKLIWKFGPYSIGAYDEQNTFLVNWYGPPSEYVTPSQEYSSPWGTFPRYSLAYIIDTRDITLRDPREDLDWMEQFLPKTTPQWLESILDDEEREMVSKSMGIVGAFDPTKSPFYNKIVLVGISVGVTEADKKTTPFYNYLGFKHHTPGVEVHANAIQTILHNNYLRILGGQLTQYYHFPWRQFLITSSLSLLAFLILAVFTPGWSAILVIIEGLVYFGLTCGFFMDDLLWAIKELGNILLPAVWVTDYPEIFRIALPRPGASLLLPVVAPLAGVLCTYTSNVVYQFAIERKDKRFYKDTFSTYIAPELIDKMFQDRAHPALGGEMGIKTALFTDIQNFSTISELLNPTQLVELLNEYLGAMTDILFDHGGTLDKYEGDAIAAFFGAPVPMGDHAYRACIVALEMQDQLRELRSKWRGEGTKWPELVYTMRVRIGINTGEMVIGNMGSKVRMNYTMMGDAVNLASRLEASAKQYGVFIQVGENTQREVEDQFEWRFLDRVRVMGKTQPVETYELLDKKGSLDAHTEGLVTVFHQAIEYYFNQEWEIAIKKFQDADQLEAFVPGLDINPSRVYINRCRTFQKYPPGDDWNGVWTLDTK